METQGKFSIEIEAVSWSSRYTNQ